VECGPDVRSVCVTDILNVVADGLAASRDVTHSLSFSA